MCVTCDKNAGIFLSSLNVPFAIKSDVFVLLYMPMSSHCAVLKGHSYADSTLPSCQYSLMQCPVMSAITTYVNNTCCYVLKPSQHILLFVAMVSVSHF